MLSTPKSPYLSHSVLLPRSPPNSHCFPVSTIWRSRALDAGTQASEPAAPQPCPQLPFCGQVDGQTPPLERPGTYSDETPAPQALMAPCQKWTTWTWTSFFPLLHKGQSSFWCIIEPHVWGSRMSVHLDNRREPSAKQKGRACCSKGGKNLFYFVQPSPSLHMTWRFFFAI